MSNTKISLPGVTWGWQQDLYMTQGLWEVQSPSKLLNKTNSAPVSQQSDGDRAFLILLLAQLGCHYTTHWKSCWSQVTSVLGPSPKPCPAPVSARQSSLRGKPCCCHAGHRARLPTWDGHWGQGGRQLPGPGWSPSSCESNPSLVLSGWDEAQLLSDPMEMFLRYENFSESLQ